MKKNLIFLLLLYITAVSAQNTYRSPLDIPLVLSANFGELRPNHFHSGIDFKTQGVINKKVYAIEEGFISRISVSPSGYGLALYIDHPNGQTSVYAHIESFIPRIADYVKAKQYEQESYKIDLFLTADELPVKKGEFIAYSGNTGSSGGPHVHFEIRNTADQVALDPLVYYKESIEDITPPQLRGIAVYPIENVGIVNGSSEKVYRTSIKKDKKGEYLPIKDTIKVWGRVGIGVNTIDRMTGTNNIYGVKTVRLFCNEEEIFKSDITTVDFADTRMINTMTDYDYWVNKRVFYEKSFIEPGNTLPIYTARNNGYIDVEEEKVYKLCYELEDLYGNLTSYSFHMNGVRQDFPKPKECTMMMRRNEDNFYEGDLFSITVPKNALYKDQCFTLNKNFSNKRYMSSLYKVNDSYVPLDKSGEMTIKLTKDSLPNKFQYGIVKVTNDKESWVGGTYYNGAMTTRISELGGSYAVSYDVEAPKITPIQSAKWIVEEKIVIKATDNKSGIASYRGTIDGEFVLFEHDVKKPLYIYRFDPQRIKKGQTHKLVFTVADACGNQENYEYEFKY